MSDVLTLDVPDLASTAWPERRDRAAGLLDGWARSLWAVAVSRLRPPLAPLQRAAVAALALEAEFAALDDAALRRSLALHARPAVRDGRPEDLTRALATVREGARRSLRLQPFASQLIGAAGLLAGRLVEMATGEGKTLTAGLAACIAGVARLPVHVVTVNDYLAGRDAHELTPLYAFFGLTVSIVSHTAPAVDKARAYRAHVTYCTNKDLVFDYLRDRVGAGGPVSRAQLAVRVLAVQEGAAETAPRLQRGLHFAIVDEADSILVDEAKTPLILAEKGEPLAPPEVFEAALALARTLAPSVHYSLDVARRALQLTSAGQACVADAVGGKKGLWRSPRAREHLVVQALRALHLFERDRQYLVADGKVQIIDEYTGRVLDGRSWEQGLHQMIEAHEGVELSADNRTLARITYQRFFCRYLRLSGMTGTAREVAPEVRATYGLQTVAVSTHRPSRRVHEELRLAADDAAKWQTVTDLALARLRQGRPVLVGTRSLAASEALSAVLHARGVAHQVLNARQDAEEAAVVARAGQPGMLTVATNMAGRGNDIRLADGVDEAGGLAVILTEFPESPRIDRQLVGRCARQGDRGGHSGVVAIGDELLAQHPLAARLAALALGSTGTRTLPTSSWRRYALLAAQRLAQDRAERRHRRTRRDTLREDRELDNQLGFAGNPV